MTGATLQDRIERAAGGDLKTRARPGLVGRALDAVVREIAPAAARRRQTNRIALALGDGYEVAKASRQRRLHSHTGGTADRHLDAQTLFQLREIARSADRQSPLIHGILERWVDNVVGPTWSVQPLTDDPEWNKAARDYFEQRAGRGADLRQRMDLRRLVRTWLRSLATDGDILPVFTARGIATYEADQIQTPYGRDAPPSLINGVEIDPTTGRDLAYWVLPRTWKPNFASAELEGTARRIPAADALMPAYLVRASQTRGVPVLAASLGMFDHLDSYITNEQVAAQVASSLTWFIKRADPAFFLDAAGELPDWVKAEVSEDGTERQLLKIEPGQVATGAMGDDLELLNPARPGVTFEPYVTVTLRMIGAGLGMPLELVLLDFSRTTYSSARASLLQAYRTFMCWQRFVITDMLAPIYERWIGQAMADGDLPLREDAWRVQWLMPTWAWLDPYKEMLAAKTAVEMGVDTLTDYIERESQTLEDYVQKRRKELGAFRTAGIPTSTAPLNLGAAPAAPGAKGNPQPDPLEDEETPRRRRGTRDD